jgi:hypothetical protein
VDCCSYSFGRRGQNGADLHRIATGVIQRTQIPANANTSHSLTSFDFQSLLLVARLRRNQAPAGFQCTRNAGFVRAVADFALIIFAATDESLAHDRMSPSEQTTVLGQVPSDLAHDGEFLSRGDVISGIPVLFSRIGVAVFFNQLLPSR